MRRRSSHRRDLRCALFLACAFVYVLCLTSQRLALKERYGQIKELETALQTARSDEEKLRVTIERSSSYAQILTLPGLKTARREQCVLLAVGQTPVENEAEPAKVEHASLTTAVGRFARLFREGEAQARPARTGEGGDDAPAR